MNDAALAARRIATQQAFYRRFGGVDLAPGVYASVVPSAPQRSLFNAVTYSSPTSLPLDRLASLYDDAGVRAWTVWVHPGDADLAAELSAAGHRLDASPEAMGAVLAEMPLDGPDVAEEPARWEDVIATNVVAYGIQDDDLDAMSLATDDVLIYATDGGAVVLAVHDHDGDAGLVYVAARPEARGRGLVAALTRQALREAADRGCTTTTLEATKLGRPVYDRVGYRSLGTLEMWERRAAQ